MGDAYWRYADGRQPPILPPAGKRPRSEQDHLPGGPDLPNYYGRDDERGAPRVIRDTDSIGASYDRFLRGTQIGSYGGGESARAISGGLNGRPADDPHIMGIGGFDPAVSAKTRPMGVIGGRPEVSLPPDASSTLFVEGLPANCSRREVAHIFRPFVGYKEVRLVTKESRRSGGEPLVLCFVDFLSPAHAATAMDALQATRRAALLVRWWFIKMSKGWYVYRFSQFHDVSHTSSISNVIHGIPRDMMMEVEVILSRCSFHLYISFWLLLTIMLVNSVTSCYSFTLKKRQGISAGIISMKRRRKIIFRENGFITQHPEI